MSGTSLGRRIFISYRRDDAIGEAGRLYDRLVSRYGSDLVFRDLDSLNPGVDFVQAIDEEIGSCYAVLVVIKRAR